MTGKQTKQYRAGIAIALIRCNVGAITDDRLPSRARPAPTALIRQPTWSTRPMPLENGAASD
jgi:hypothetical protein